MILGTTYKGLKMLRNKGNNQPKKEVAPNKVDVDGESKNLLAGLMSKAKPATPKTANKKTDKPVIQLTEPEEIAAVDQFTSSDAILKVAKGAQEASKSKATRILQKHYLRLCVERGYRPENPHVSTEHSRLNLQVKHVSKFNRTVSGKGKGEPISVKDQLRDLGFDDDVIEQIITKVIKEKTHLGLKLFTDLTEGTTQEKQVAQKLMSLVKKHLTEDELALVLEQSVDTTVDESWQDIAVGIAVKESAGDIDRGVEVLGKLYGVIAPQFVMGQMIFTGELEPALHNLHASPVTAAERKVISSPTGKYEAVCEGNDVTLYLVKPDGNELVGTKKCANPNHAEMSARKWFREPESLAEILSNFSQKS